MKRITIQRVAKWKIWFDRARAYIGYIQFMGTAYIVIKLLRNSTFKTWTFDYWFISFPILFVVFFGLCMVLGYVESLFKIREYEQANYSEINPEWKKLMDGIDSINKKLEAKETVKKEDNG